MHFFTSITTNYLPKARVLAASIKRLVKNSYFILVVSDDLPAGFSLDEEPFDTVWFVEDIGIQTENLNMWIYMHTVVELCTAVKGQALVKILEEIKAEKAIYLDPDTVVFNDLSELDALLDTHDIILTPHLCEPENIREAIWDNEVCALQHGVYNLGFIAVANRTEGMRFAKWWRDRLNMFCYDDISNGLFTDQRWADLAPAFFDRVYLLKSPAYNVATWNLSKRRVTGEDGNYFVDGLPLKFYHFSGFDSGANESMMQKYGNSSVNWALRNWYAKAQERTGQSELGRTVCKYMIYENGEVIPKEHRRILKTRPDVVEYFKDTNPYETTGRCYYLWVLSELSRSGIAGYTIESLKDKRIEELTRENERLKKYLNPLYLARKIYRKICRRH